MALKIPEIVREILGHVSDSRITLAAAARVNRAWSAPALDLLWQRVPEHAFVSIAGRRAGKSTAKKAAAAAAAIDDDAVAARRQFYAAKVRCLRVLRHPEIFRALAFPQLREARLIFSDYGLKKGLTMAAAVAPFVRSPLLEKLDTHVDPGVVELLLARRPRLRELTILSIDGESVRDTSGSGDDNDDDDDGSGVLSKVEKGPDGKPLDVEAFQRASFGVILKQLEKRRNAPGMPLDVQRRLFEYLATDCATTLERLSLRGADDEVMHELVVGLFATHQTLAALQMYFYTWRNAQLKQVEERVKQQQQSLQPYRALKSLETEVAATAMPTLVRLLNPSVFENFKLDITNDDFEDGSSEAGSHSSAGAGHGNDSGDTALDASDDTGDVIAEDDDEPSGENDGSNEDENGGGGDADHADDAVDDDGDSDIEITAWDITASQALSSIAVHLPRLRVLHLSFFQYTLLRKPAVMSLCALANLEELTIVYAGNSDYGVVDAELSSDDFVELLSSLGKLRRLKLSNATGVTPRWLLLAGQARPQLEQLRLPEHMVYDLSTLAEVSAAQTPLFPDLAELDVMNFDMQLEEPNKDW